MRGFSWTEFEASDETLDEVNTVVLDYLMIGSVLDHVG